MEVDNEVLQKLEKLKNKEISITDLSDDCFLGYFAAEDGGIFINTENILKLLDEGVCNFQDIVDRIKSISETADYLGCDAFKKLLENVGESVRLFEMHNPTKEELKYLLSKIDKIDELRNLCDNRCLLERILNEFLLDEVVDKLNTVVEEDVWCSKRSIHNIFDLIEFTHTHYFDDDWNSYKLDKEYIDENLLKLNRTNKNFYKLNFHENGKLELIEILQTSEHSRAVLNQVVESNLHDTYDFDTLKNLLNKDDNKKRSKLNL